MAYYYYSDSTTSSAAPIHEFGFLTMPLASLLLASPFLKIEYFRTLELVPSGWIVTPLLPAQFGIYSFRFLLSALEGLL